MFVRFVPLAAKAEICNTEAAQAHVIFKCDQGPKAFNRSAKRYCGMLVSTLAITALLAGCETPPPAKPPAPRPPPAVIAPPPPPVAPAVPAPPPPPTPAELAKQDLSNGIKAYEDARYAQAAKLLSSALDLGLDKPEQVESLKYLAFVACSQGRRAECKSNFDRIFMLSPEFQLSKSEAGHPMWGPIFRDSKRQSDKARTPAKK